MNLVRHLLCTALLAASSPATATSSRSPGQGLEVHGHRYDAHDEHGGKRLHLTGAGRWKWKGLVPVYSSAVYLEKAEDAARIDQAVPRCLVITYYREVGKKDLVAAADNYLAKNLTPAQLASIADRVKQMNDWYVDVKEGDRYHLVFLPGTGTQLLFNGQLRGTIPGDDFGPAYFSVWLGKACVSDSLRDEMLGLK